MSISKDLLEILRREHEDAFDRLEDAKWEVYAIEREIEWIADAVQELSTQIEEEEDRKYEDT